MSAIIVAIISGLFGLSGGGVVAFFTIKQARQMADKKVQLTDAQIEKTSAETDEIAVTSMQMALKTLREELIVPLLDEKQQIKKQLEKVTYELSRFRKAIEKIPGCAHADTCPVTHELQSAKEKYGANQDG